MTESAGATGRLHELRRAINDLSQSLLTEIGNDDVAAIDCVIALEDALSGLSELLGLIPSLLAIASLGPRVEERVATRRSEVERQHADLVKQRAALDANRELIRQLEQFKAEREQITGKIAELQRVKEIIEELPSLRVTLTVLQESVSAGQAAEAVQVGVDLTAAVRAIADLSDRQRLAVDADMSATADDLEKAVKETVDREQQLAEVREQLAAQIADGQELKKALERDLPALQLHLQADADLVKGLEVAGIGDSGSRIDRVKRVLAGVGERLAEVDGTLKPMLITYGHAYERALEARR